MKYLAPASWLGLLYSAGWHTAVAPDIGSIGEQIVVVGQTQHYSDGLWVRYRLGYCTHLGGTIPPVLGIVVRGRHKTFRDLPVGLAIP
jgi:hypothetical protein